MLTQGNLLSNAEAPGGSWHSLRFTSSDVLTVSFMPYRSSTPMDLGQ